MEQVTAFLSSTKFRIAVGAALAVILVTASAVLVRFRRRVRSKLELLRAAALESSPLPKIVDEPLSTYIEKIKAMLDDKLLGVEVESLEHEGRKLLLCLIKGAELEPVEVEINRLEAVFQADISSSSEMGKHLFEWKDYEAKAARSMDRYRRLAHQRDDERIWIGIEESLKQLGKPTEGLRSRPHSNLHAADGLADLMRRRYVASISEVIETSKAGAEKCYQRYRTQKKRRYLSYSMTYLFVFLVFLTLLPGVLFDPVPIKLLSVLILPTALFALDKMWLSPFLEPIFRDWRRWALIQSVYELYRAKIYARCYSAGIMAIDRNEQKVVAARRNRDK